MPWLSVLKLLIEIVLVIMEKDPNAHFDRNISYKRKRKSAEKTKEKKQQRKIVETESDDDFMESIKTKKNSPVAGPSKRSQTKIFQDNASKDLKTTRQRSTVPSPEVNTPPAVHQISDSDISPYVTTPITPHVVVTPPAAHHISDYDTTPDLVPSTPPTKTNPQQ